MELAFGLLEHEWWVKEHIWPLFLQAERPKRLEVRVRSYNTDLVFVGDVIFFNRRVRRRVVAIRGYRSFTEMLDAEEPEGILPGGTKETILELLRQFYTSKAEQNGVMVFELEPCE